MFCLVLDALPHGLQVGGAYGEYAVTFLPLEGMVTRSPIIKPLVGGEVGMQVVQVACFAMRK